LHVVRVLLRDPSFHTTHSRSSALESDHTTEIARAILPANVFFAPVAGQGLTPGRGGVQTAAAPRGHMCHEAGVELRRALRATTTPVATRNNGSATACSQNQRLKAASVISLVPIRTNLTS